MSIVPLTFLSRSRSGPCCRQWDPTSSDFSVRRTRARNASAGNPARAGSHVPSVRRRSGRPPAAGKCPAGQNAWDRRLHRRSFNRLRPQLKLRHPTLSKGVHQGPAHHLVHHRLIPEPDLGLGRMHVDVQGVGWHLDEEVYLRAAFLDRRRAVRVDDGVSDRPILDDAAVDEDVLRAARRPLFSEGGDEPGEPKAARLLPDLEQVVAFAVELIQAVAQRRRRWTLQDRTSGARQPEPDLRIREGELRRHPRDLRRLGAVGLEELPPRRKIVEEIVDLDGRALGRRDLHRRRDDSAVDANLRPARAPLRPRSEHEVGDRRHRRAAPRRGIRA